MLEKGPPKCKCMRGVVALRNWVYWGPNDSKRSQKEYSCIKAESNLLMFTTPGEFYICIFVDPIKL